MVVDKSEFERYPPGMPMDETDVNLRAFFTRMADERVERYDPHWTDEQVLAWEPDFNSERALMLTCSEREVGVEEYRRVLEQYIEWRKLQAAAK